MNDSKSAMEDLSKRIQRLEARQQLSDLVANYCMAVDYRDLEALADLYTSDAEFEGAAGKARGREAIISYYQERLSLFGPTYHYPHSQTVEFQGENEASGIVHAHAELDIEGSMFIIALRYIDRYAREDGQWKFRERTIQTLYAVPLAELPEAFGNTFRKRWPGAEPETCELPETLDSWKKFTGDS